MKRCLQRAYWGINDKTNRVLERKYRVDSNIEKLLHSQHGNEFITYCWGTENYNHLKERGITNLNLVSKKPYQWDLTKYQYRHKLESLRICMEEDGYDEIIHLDWDAYPIKPMPENIWDECYKKETFQGNLQQYKRQKCMWRKEEPRKVINGGGIYIRDKTIPSKIIKCWESNKITIKRSCEAAMCLYVDELHGKWIGCSEFDRLHEFEFCKLKRFAISKNKPNACWVHYAGFPN